MNLKGRRGRKGPRGLRLTAAAVTALVLATGCVTSEDKSSEPVSTVGAVPKDVKGDVRILMEGVPDTDVIKGLLPAFQKEYPGVKVNIETLTYDQMRDKLVASFRAPKASYDLVIVDNPWMYDFGKAGFLQPLEGRVKGTSGYDYEDFAPSLRKINEVDGHTYGIPFYNYALGLIYRKDLFSKAGQQPPKSLGELKSAAAKLNSAGRSGIAMQPQRGYKIFEEWGNFLLSAGGSIYGPDGKPTLDTPQARQALNEYIAMYKASAPKGSLNWAFDEALRAVSADKAAMMVSYNWMLPTLNKKGGQGGKNTGKYGLAPMPGGKQVLGSWNWGIPANSGTSDAAWAFIAWTTSKQAEKQRVIAGGAPVRSSVLADPEVASKGSGAEYYSTVGQLLPNSTPLSQGANGEEMIQAVGTELNAAVSGKKSVDEALKSAQQQASKIQGQ